MADRARAAGLVVPLLVGLFDAVGTVDVVSAGGRCASDCTAGVLLLPFAPTVTPLLLAGIGEDRPVSVAAVVAAYAVVLGLLVAWWWFVGGRITRAVSDGRLLGAVPRPVRYVVLFAGAALLTFLIKVPVLATASWAGPAAGLPVEVAVWAVLRWLAQKVRTPG